MAWNRADTSSQSAARKPASKSPSAVKGAIAGVVVVVLAVAAYFLLFTNGPEKPKTEKVEKKPAKISEVKPAAAPKVVDKPVEDKAKVAREAMAEKIKKMTSDERWQYFLEQAKKQPLDLTPRSNQVYRTSTEQMMAMVFGTKLGDPPPRLPNIPLREQVHFAEILIADNPIAETDSEKVKQTKETLAAAKKELMKFIKGGGDADQFFDYYRGELQQARDEWLETQKSVFKVIKEDPDIAEVYINEVNDRLSQKGIKPVMVPPKLREKFGQK